MADLTPILRQLRELPPGDLAQVQLKMSAFLALSGGAPASASTPSPSRSDDYLLEGVHQELRRRGLLGQEARLPARVLPAGYAKGSAVVRGGLERCIRRELQPPERLALGRLAARALADYLVERKVPVSARTLLNNFDKIPLALDASFPDYLACGLLPSCWGAK